jgi:hypothetical protein
VLLRLRVEPVGERAQPLDGRAIGATQGLIPLAVAQGGERAIISSISVSGSSPPGAEGCERGVGAGFFTGSA